MHFYTMESSVATEKDEVDLYVLSGKEGLKNQVEEEVTTVRRGWLHVCEGGSPYTCVPVRLQTCVSMSFYKNVGKNLEQHCAIEV